MKRIASVIMLVLSLVGIWMLALAVQPVRSASAIYIRADGLIEPPTVSIASFDNVTYYFTGNIDGSILVERSNIVIDGKGFILHGDGEYNGKGFYLHAVGNVTIKNTNIQNFFYGICLNSTSSNIISENYITNNERGIALFESSSNIISSNNLTTNSRYSILLASSSNQNRVFKNNVLGTNAGAIALGIWQIASSNNSIHGNNVTMVNGYNIILESSFNNIIHKNSLQKGKNGITISQTAYNTISENNLIDNNYGAALSGSSNNTFYHNNFVDNKGGTRLYESPNNKWDNGYPSGGNYWSNYTGTDLNHNGINESPYAIGVNNVDNYPLVGAFSSFNTSLGEHLNIVSNSTIENFEYYESNSTIKIYVANMSDTQVFGFCRVCIPYALMSEPYNVTVNGVNPIYWNYNLYDNGTHKWIYFAYEHSSLEIIIIPEFSSIVLSLLLMVTSLLVVIRLLKTKTVIIG